MSDILNTYIVDYRGKAYKVKAENLLNAWEIFKEKHKRYTNKGMYNYTRTIEQDGFEYALFFSTYFNDHCVVTNNIHHKRMERYIRAEWYWPKCEGEK